MFHDKAGDIVSHAVLSVCLVPLSALAPLALAAALLAIPANEARAHSSSTAMFHAETYPLQEAAEAGDLDFVNHFLDVHGVDVNAKDDENYTPLIEAAYWGRVVVVSTLIAAGADVNAKTNYGYTPLSEAVRKGHIAVVSTLIAAGANVNATTSYNETPLHEAAQHGPASIVSVLLAAGAEVSIKRGDGETPLHLAAGNGHADIASMLLSAGADVNAEDNYGNTPLHEPDTASVASVLIAAGADVNAKNQYGDTPLRDTTSWAAGPLIISVLIAAGGHWGEACESGNVVNPAGPSPPCVAVAECAAPSVLNAGTNRCDCPAPKIGIDGAAPPGDCHAETYPLHEAARAGDLDAVNHLITVHMADVNATTSYGDTPLHYATGDGTGVGHVPVVSVLIAAGANVNAKEDEGQVPLHNAAIKGNIPVISMLIAAGADVNARQHYNQTPLHEAAEGGKAVAISVLIAAGASVNAKDAGGGTPLHEAARNYGWNESVSVFSALIAAGADVNVKDDNDRTPLLIAHTYGSSNNRAAVVAALIAAGGHWGEACVSPAVVNPAGPDMPCIHQTCQQQNRVGGANTTGCGDCLTNYQEFGNQCEIPISCPITGQAPDDSNTTCVCPEDQFPIAGACQVPATFCTDQSLTLRENFGTLQNADNPSQEEAEVRVLPAVSAGRRF